MGKMIRLTSAVPILACLVWGSVRAEEISQAQLVQLGAKALQFKRKDEFSPAFDDRTALGRSFHLTLPLPKNEIPSMPDYNGGWTYNPDSQTLP